MAGDRQGGELVDVRWHDHAVSRDDRERAAGHKGCVLWFRLWQEHAGQLRRPQASRAGMPHLCA